MPPAAIVTPSQVSQYTQGKVSASDPRLQGLIDGATAAVRRYCGWHIAPTYTETIVLDGPGGHVLTLPTLHVTALGPVTENGAVLVEYTPSVTTGVFEWSTIGTVRRTCGRWTDRYRAVSVTMTHGFDSAPDVAQIIMQVVAQALSSPLGATREQAGALSVSWATTAPGVSGGLSLLQRDLDVLNLYRLGA
jgi:hypothetical protein